MADQYAEVKVKNIHTDPATPNVRGSVIDTTDLQSSISSDGLHDPLWVRPSGEPGEYYLINGHRRWTAVKALGWQYVPVLIKQVSQAEARRLMLISDMQKPHPHVVLDVEGEIVAGKALGIKQEIEQSGCSQVELGLALGISADVIGAYMTLFDESLPIKKKVASGQLSITAYARMKHQPEAIKQAVAEIEGNVPGSKIRELIKQQNKESQENDEGEPSPVTVQGFYLGVDDEQPIAAQLNAIRDTLAHIERDQLGDSELHILGEISQIIDWLT